MNQTGYQAPPQNYMLTGLLFLTMVVPSLSFMFGAQSMVQGLVAVIMCYIITVFNVCSLSNISKNLLSTIKIVTICLAFVFIHGLTNYVLHIEQFNLPRFSLSFLYLMFFIFGAFSLALIADKISMKSCSSAMNVIFTTFILVGILGVLGFSPFQVGGKPMVFYAEPSHYALDFLPFLFFIVIQATLKKKILYLLVAFEIAVIIHSLTLMVGVALISIVALQLRMIPIAVGGFFILYSSEPLIQNFLSLVSPSSPFVIYHKNIDSYLSGRVVLPALDAVSKSSNGSFLVYFSGWERAYLNFVNYLGFGSGFQQLGYIGNEGTAIEKLISIYRRPLGLLDGGAVAAKFLSEFGLFALMLLGAYTATFFAKVKNLRMLSTSSFDIKEIKNTFFMCCFVIFSVNLFVRGLGYFSSSSFLFLASLFWFLLRKTDVETEHPQKPTV